MSSVMFELRVNEKMFPDQCIRSVRREFYLLLDDESGDLKVFNHPPGAKAKDLWNWCITLTSLGQVVKLYQEKPVETLGKPLPQDSNYKLVVDHRANAWVKLQNDFMQDIHIFHIFDRLEEYFNMYSDTCIRSPNKDNYLAICKDNGNLVVSDTPKFETDGSYYIVLTQRGNVSKYQHTDHGDNFLKGYGQLLKENDDYILELADNSNVLVMLDEKLMQKIDLP